MTLNDPTAPLDDDEELVPVTDPRKDELTSDVPEAPGDEEDTGVPDQGRDDSPDEDEADEAQGGTTVKILGREPTVIVGVIVALISLAGTLGYRFLSPDQAGLWIVVVNAIAGIVTALTVRPIAPAAFTYAIGAIVALAAAYGLNIAPETVSAINALVIPVLALLTRNQVSPIETVVTKASLDPVPQAAEAQG